MVFSKKAHSTLHSHSRVSLEKFEWNSHIAKIKHAYLRRVSHLDNLRRESMLATVKITERNQFYVLRCFFFLLFQTKKEANVMVTLKSYKQNLQEWLGVSIFFFMRYIYLLTFHDIFSCFFS